MHPTRVRRLAVAGLAALVALGAACGDDDDEAATDVPEATAAEGGAEAPAPQGEPLKVGIITTLTGPIAASSGLKTKAVAEAWERHVNEDLGGIQGRPVEVLIEDDLLDQARGQALARELVEDEGVIALVPDDGTVQAWMDYAIGQGMPIIGGFGLSEIWYTTPGMFVTSTDTYSGLRAQVHVAKDAGGATMLASLYCAEDPSCEQINPALQPEAEALGIGFTSLSITEGQPSYTAECLRMQDEGVDFVSLNLSDEASTRIIEDCRAQGFEPNWGTSLATVGDGLLGLEGVTIYGNSYTFVPEADHPATNEFREIMDRHADGDTWRGGYGLFSWGGLETLRTVLEAGPAEATRADVLDGLHALDGETLGGLLANPLDYEPGAPVGFGEHPCYFTFTLEDGEIEVPGGLTPACLPS